MNRRIITVRDFESDSIHRLMDVTNLTENEVAILLDGLYSEFNLEDFYIDDTEDHDD